MYAVARTDGRNCWVKGLHRHQRRKGGVIWRLFARRTANRCDPTVAEIAANGRGEGNGFVDVEIVTGDVPWPSQLVRYDDVVISGGGGRHIAGDRCRVSNEKADHTVTGYRLDMNGWRQITLWTKQLASFVRG